MLDWRHLVGIFGFDELIPLVAQPVTWYWLNDDKKTWTPYSAELNSAIENAYNAKSGLRMEIGRHFVYSMIHFVASKMYVFDFNTNKQVNEKTGYGRNIERRVGNSKPSGPCYWEWQDSVLIS